ncbi:MAG: competence protein ComEA [Chloroflexia bacterium]|jgi:competence protein ComEA|nr:competence protein ComEA [Chloroflexia bacterium]
MRTLLAIRIPLAWFLLAMTLVAAAGLVWLIATKGSTPTNAVLIAGPPTSSAAAVSISKTSGTPVAQTVPVPEQPQAIVVYVSGEVTAPGVYTLPVGSRVADAVAAAGGFSDQANQEGINLAARLSDEQHISIPRVGATVVATTPDTVGATVEAKNTPSVTPTHANAPAGKVNINTATAKELEALPGIGTVLAERIVVEREANGPFKTVDDLMRVPGIKEGIMSQLRDLVTVGP